MRFLTDPCGMVCAVITHALLIYAQYVVTYIILLPWFEMSIQGVLHQLCFTACTFLGAWSHLRAMTSDPGIVPVPPSPLPPLRARPPSRLIWRHPCSGAAHPPTSSARVQDGAMPVGHSTDVSKSGCLRPTSRTPHRRR